MPNTPPLSATYLRVQEARQDAILPSAPNWDATPIEMACPGMNSVTFYFSYEAAAVGGAFDYRIEYSPYAIAANVPLGAQEWCDEPLYAAAGVVAGVVSASLIQHETQTYTEESGGGPVVPEAFPVGPIELDGTVERIRVVARESGLPLNAGNLQVQANFGVEV